MKNGKRLDSQLHLMSDGEIINYLWDNPALIKEHSNYTGKELDESRDIIREVLTHVQKENFIQFIRTCYKAFKVSGEGNRFFRYIISYIQDEKRILTQVQKEEPLPKEIPDNQEFFPLSLMFNYNDPFLFDFSIDFFLNNAGETYLRQKYKLNHKRYKTILAKLLFLGIHPTLL